MRRIACAIAVLLLALVAGCDPRGQFPPSTGPAATSTPTRTVPPTSATAVPTTTPSSTTRPSTTRPRTSTPRASTTSVTPPPPSGGPGSEAATRFGWGVPDGGDEFTGSALDLTKWGPYDGVGHGGNGRRSPSAFSVAGGILTVTGLPNGTTGGMAYRDGQLHGRWETRMRVPAGDDQYHPVLLLWPDAEDWPVGGEVDYAETTAASDSISFFLHYSAQNRQTQASRDVDLATWHNYAVEWTASCITGYLDAVQWFRDCDAGHLPPRSMHQTIQLDYFPGRGSPQRTVMLVDWVRIYDL